MSRTPIFILAILCLISTAAYAGDFKLSSPTIENGAVLSKAQVYNRFGCGGENISPALKWTAGPKGTKSYAITVYDPDAPTGSGWWHWIVYNIPANVTELAEGAGDPSQKLLPRGAVQGLTSYGIHAFGGACPPKGAKPHRYIFTVHALKVAKINIPYESSPAMIGSIINANSLGKASLTALYGR